MSAPTAATFRLLIFAGLILVFCGFSSCMVDDVKQRIKIQQQKQKTKLNELSDL